MSNIIKFEREPKHKSDLSVIEMLESLLEELKEAKHYNEEYQPNKALILLLDDKDENSYWVNYDHNLKLSECITLNRIIEARLLIRMGFLPDE